MIQTGIESKVKIQDIISNQLPEFILDESPKTVDFLKQYYISQEFQGGPVDISDNLDDYLKLDNLKPEVVVDSTTLTSNITLSDTTINVSSTRGFPNKYGLLKIDNEIITYTGITTNTFTGCVRGFSGITKYKDDLNKENLVFESSTANSHDSDSSIQNLSSLFLKEFYKKLKTTFAPGFENISLVDEVDAGNFIKRAKDFYSSKGTDEAIKILFKVIFGEKPSIINLEDYLIKPSSANYVRREVVIAEAVSGEPLRIIGQTIVKSTDENTSASVSSVEAFTRKGKTYFLLELYVSNDGRSSVEGNFIITPNTKLTENAFVGDSILTVDSTISFPESGNLISGTNTISYTGKSINQFFGCTGINSNIVKSSNIRSEDTYFSYEDGDISKKVEIILLGVIGNLEEGNKNFIVNEGDLVGIKNLGDKVENNGSDWKEIFANSFIYNTSASYQVIDNSNITLGSSIEESSLKVGDEVEVIERGSIPEVIVPTDSSIYIRSINFGENTLELQNALNSGTSDPIFSSTKEFNIRRKLNKINKSGSQFSSDSLLSDILNLYTDKDEYAYVASNSLPSSVNDNFKDSSNNPIKNYRLNIDTNIKSLFIDNISNLVDLESEVFNTIKIDGNVPFLTGDKVFYSPESEPLVGLITGTYFVEKISDDKFRLYGSQSLIDLGNNTTFQSPSAGIGSHTFILDSQRDSELGVQKLLRKFPLEKNIEQGSGDITTPGSTGMLINGVEINNYKSNDKIYFGPIEELNVLNGGENYDVINPPIVSVDKPSIGSTAFIQPVISGKFEKIYVDSQDYDIDKIGPIDISGGNGTGAVIEPVLISRPRDILFNARNFSIGGGVDQTGNKIVFLDDHNLVNGQEVVYNSLGNNAIKIGTLSNNKILPDNSTYFVRIVNNKAIKLYFNQSDQQSDTNSVGIFTGSSGTHRFSTLSSTKQLDYIKIINSGEGYTNRKLITPASGISTTNNTVTFKNHGFKNGEIVEYKGSVSGTLTFKKGGIAGKFFNGNWRSVISTGNIGSIPLTTENDSSNVTGTNGLPDPSYRFGVNFWSVVDFGNNLGNTYGWIGVGYFRPRVSGTYKFYTRSDDGSGIWVGDLALEGQTRTKANATVDNGLGSGQSAIERSGTIDLIAGVYYPFRAVMEETTGSDVFRISYEGPGITKTTDLSEDFYASATADSTLTGDFDAPVPIAGLETTNQYYVLKLDDDTFRICDAGIGGTITSNFERQDYVKFISSGSQNQVFKYPDISVSVKYTTVGIGSTTQELEDLVLTPVIKGEIIDAYVYDSGTGYGSTVLNYEDKPRITIKNGKSAQLTPIVVDGRLTNVTISYSGSEYFSIPDLVISGSGIGAELRAIVNSNGQISDVKVINTGIGYSSTDTRIEVVPSGKNALIDSRIRELHVNNNVSRFSTGEVVLKGKDKLQYSVSKYFEELRNSFSEDGTLSGIIGWAYDGNPIYGPTGYVDPENIFSGLKTLESGYVIDTLNVVNRPLGFDPGFFIEDYKFDNSGDLDRFNGRYEKNDEYPNGVYAYHATLEQFPYFIGNEYRSKLISDYDLDQSFDFNNSNLLRNTLPYKVSEQNANYDFINETSDVLEQKIEVLSVTSGSIESIEIQNKGIGYKVGDQLIFDDTGTSGSGLNVAVKSIEGKDIVDVIENSTSYPNSIFTWKSSEEIKISILPNHNLLNSDFVTISGFSTNLTSLNGTHKISVPSYLNGRCISTISAAANPGFTTEIYVTPIPKQISIGSSIGIGTERLTVLGIFQNENILRVQRGLIGVSHTVGTAVSFIPDSFTISKSLDKFNSKLNEQVFFNPRESVGLSTINGVGYSTSFVFGNISVNANIPSRSIRIENHPFVTNQPIVYNSNGSSNLTVSTDGTLASEITIPTNLFVVDKNPNLIGLKTAINGEELFFHSNGSDNDKYSLTVNNTKIFGDVEKNVVTVSVSTAHELQQNDSITLEVKPNLSVGIGSTTFVSVVYNSTIGNIIVNPIGFNSTGINTITNEITINDHGLQTGDKVFYENGPLDDNEYFVFKINNRRFKLCEVHIDSQKNPPTVVSFASTGSSDQTLSLVNPQLNPVKNNDLVFDLTDSSLSGYDFKIYTDSKFKNEFVSSGSTDSFNITGVGTVGVSTNASLTLRYDSEIPTELYYNLEKDGVLLNSDTEVKNNSRILYSESAYNDTYEILGVGTTTFDLNINKKLERSFYISTECDVLEYSTTSIGATGSVKSLNILSSGTGYKKLPLLVSTNSKFGLDLIVNTKSDVVGSIKQSKTVNNKFTYSSDKTLRPTAIISPSIKVKNSSTLDQISIIDGGNGYTTPPKLIFVDPVSRDSIDSGFVELRLSGSSIAFADIVVEPKGLPDDSVEVLTIENTNGIAIEKVESIDALTFKCTISTPGVGNTFTLQPFEVGDSVFIEGVQKISTDGDGFNSEDYGYRFLEVTNYDNSGINDTVTVSVSGLTTNTGTPKTIQDFSGVIIRRQDYPTFQTVRKQSKFSIGEKISSNGIVRDLEVIESNGNELKIFGKYQLSLGEIIRGVKSDSIATIDSLISNEGNFSVEYSDLRNIGWTNGIGKLNEDYQVIPDNDYYQNLSYSVKSSITYRDQQSPVESLVHTSGLKNFADTQVSRSTNAGIGKSNDGFTLIYDIIDDKRVDTINNFDNVVDEDVVNSKSKFLKLQNRKLTDFIELKNINVLSIDNIDNQFSNFEGENTEFLSIDEIVNTSYEKYLLRVTSEDRTEYQLTDITILSNGNNSVIVENESLYNSASPYGSFDLVENEFQETFLRFNPVDAFNTNYDLKLLKQNFNTNVTGIAGTESVGFIDLIGSVDTAVGTGVTNIFKVNDLNFESFYVDAQVIDTVTNDSNYVKLYITHDKQNTYLSEYYIDSDLSPLTGNQIGTFTAYLIDGDEIKLDHSNSSTNPISIKSNVVGFGTTTSGIGDYRFKSTDQIDGQERSIVYNSNFYSTVSTASTVINTLDKTLFDSSKSIVQVSAGATKALHQVLMLFDGIDVYTQQLPFLSASTSDTFDDAVGIGTFGGEISGNDILLKFYPDDQNQEIDIEILNTSIYRELDILNDYNDLSYGSVTQSVDEKFYNAINLERINKTNFKLTVDSTPIFSKAFNPNSVALSSTTGEFNIENHFFVTGEELVYTPNSTIVGVGTSPMQTGSGNLPSTVYAIKITEDKFKVALSTSAALSNNGVTFTSLGEGNAHKLSMKENNTKCIISIDGLVQYPIAFTKISHTLSGNVGGSLGINTTFVSLSGISTVNIQDILYVDDEYMGVVNIGFGNTNVGPITNEGDIALAEVKRAFVGSSATSHSDGSEVRVYKGAFNIIDEQIHFAEPPRGNPQIDKTKSNLDFETSKFTGRVFLKSNYDANKVYDDISDEFTGIGRTFALTVQGSSSVGIGTSGGNGLVFINNIYQSPKTANNPLQFNYLISEDSSAGISTVEFSGIARPDNPLVLVSSETDINVNETPRGGIIVSYGSTPGLGFAPLVGASVTAIVGAGGSITSIGIGTTGTFGSGYNGLVSIGVSIFEAGHSGAAATITATANVGAGGSLTFNIVGGGSGYVDPQIFVSDPSYDNLPVIGVSRIGPTGVAATTDTGIGLLLDVKVGGASTTGIGSTYFEVTEFKISRPGYSFQRGDVFKPVGLVTDSFLSSALSEFTINVVDTYSDNFAAWEFGELDYIDSISQLQDGVRTKFPLRYNQELLSFEAEEGSPLEANINNILVIFINGVVQEPVVNFIFDGGTTLAFTKAPLPTDEVEIYFYKGIRDTDSKIFTDILPTVKTGDIVQVISNNSIPDTITQDERVVYNISGSDKIETDRYSGVGIDEINFKPVSWTKQKVSRKVNGEFISKSRDLSESLIFPTARIIKDVSTTDNEIFVDGVELFNYEDGQFDPNNSQFNDKPSAGFDALIVNGISTTGFTTGLVENITSLSIVDGFSGIVTGITTSPGIGTAKAIKFDIIRSSNFTGLSTGYPIYIYDTQVGNGGIKSISNLDSDIVGIGDDFVDNIYYISDWSSVQKGTIYVATLTCNVRSDSNLSGIASTGSPTTPIGKYSWGRLSQATRSSNPISIGVSGNIVSGLSSYPTIQRRNFGIRQTGALPKIVS